MPYSKKSLTCPEHVGNVSDNQGVAENGIESIMINRFLDLIAETAFAVASRTSNNPSTESRK